MRLVGIMMLAEEVGERGSVVLLINNIGRSLTQSSLRANLQICKVKLVTDGWNIKRGLRMFFAKC